MSREIKFRAKFRHVLNGEEVWQYIGVNQHLTMPSYVQVTEWEQYTGLKDKNGVEIFEGDIITHYNGMVSHFTKEQVIYWEGSFAAFQNANMALVNFNTPMYVSVEGNIHENKDLLK
jgi:uncharacterized phage protein (TIGR01671 family)